MFLKRMAVILVLLPLGLVAIFLGSPYYTLFITIFLGMAAWEYGRMFHIGGYQPSSALIVGGTLALIAGRAFNGLESTPWLLSLAIFASMTYHLVMYEKGRDHAGTDFAITISGILYFGFVGSYLLSLRYLPEGEWWLLLVLTAVWLADGGAYLIGSRWGRHKLSRRLSPKKSWEGYLAGIVFGVVGAPLLVLLFTLWLKPGTTVTPLWGVIIGLVMGIVPTLGDLGESMFKRQAGVKDSSNLLPGHGGFFDRIDSWLWAAVIGFYIITWFVLP